MRPLDLPKMAYSYSTGWNELIRIHPSVRKLFVTYVMPMSVIPPVMFLYSNLVTPGEVFPALVPGLTPAVALAVALTFYLAELAMVPLMGALIQQIGDVVDAQPRYEDAFMLAAVAPTPLWLAAFALFIPSTIANALILAAAWVISAALIYHGVYPLFHLETRNKARVMGFFVLLAGVVAWFALLVVLALALSMIAGPALTTLT